MIVASAQTHELMEILHGLSNKFSEGTFSVKPREMFLRAVAPNHLSMVEIVVPTSMSSRSRKTRSLYVGIRQLGKIMNRIGSAPAEFKLNAHSLCITKMGSWNTKYTLSPVKLWDVKPGVIRIPRSPHTVLLTGPQFHRILTDIGDNFQEIKVSCIDRVMTFEASEEHLAYSFEYGPLSRRSKRAFARSVLIDGLSFLRSLRTLRCSGEVKLWLGVRTMIFRVVLRSGITLKVLLASVVRETERSLKTIRPGAPRRAGAR